ncbi:MAG: ABC-2 type transport system ATP-binding protein [Myxococcota bacterium]|jgi:ABC-2 type transport system ATP-binding protein
MIETKSLSKQYGRTVALDNLSASVRRGEILGFLGPNGAGKSTALKILSGYLPQTSGEAYINGLSLRKNSVQARALVGYLPENFVAPNELYVHEYLRYRAGLKGIARRQRTDEVQRVMKLVALEDRSHQRFDALSKGFKQRLGVADCLLGDPPVLILDEPFSGLDPLQRQDFRNILRGLKDKNKAIIFSSHVLPEVEDIADRVLIIHHGKTRVTADVDQLLASHQKVIFAIDGNHNQIVKTLSRCCTELQNSTVVRDNLFTAQIPSSSRTACLQDMLAAELLVTSFSSSKRDLEDVFAEFVSTPIEVI